jgi:hypothetical protein
VEDKGTCPSAMPSEYDGVHGGTHAGRFCWVVAGPDCKAGQEGCIAQTLHLCIDCEFLKQVNEEEGSNFALTAKRAKVGGRGSARRATDCAQTEPAPFEPAD